MVKSGFSCKQFHVEHSQSAQKVTTDSLILGSWCDVNHARHILDIGSGCGLLALMLAQRTDANATIDAIEIEPKAAEQASNNVMNSPWPDKVSVHYGDVLAWRNRPKYDLIVSNPPYFPPRQHKTGSIAPTASRQVAREQSQLNFKTLSAWVARHLNPKGRFSAIVPVAAFDSLQEALSENGLDPCRRLRIRPGPNHDVRLVAMEAGHQHLIANEYSDTELLIKDSRDEYSDDYRALCREFYLNF